MAIMQPREIKGDIGTILLYSDFVAKKQDKFLRYDLLNNEYKTIKQLSRFSHFPVIVEYSGLVLILDNCGKHLTKRNLPKDWAYQLFEILVLLDELEITHRNIKLENLLVRNNIIYLVNFEWAVDGNSKKYCDRETSIIIGSGENWDNELAILRVAAELKRTLI